MIWILIVGNRMSLFVIYPCVCTDVMRPMCLIKFVKSSLNGDMYWQQSTQAELKNKQKKHNQTAMGSNTSIFQIKIYMSSWLVFKVFEGSIY